jgi:hypothetical protein
MVKERIERACERAGRAISEVSGLLLLQRQWIKRG